MHRRNLKFFKVQIAKALFIYLRTIYENPPQKTGSFHHRDNLLSGIRVVKGEFMTTVTFLGNVPELYSEFSLSMHDFCNLLLTKRISTETLAGRPRMKMETVDGKSMLQIS